MTNGRLNRQARLLRDTIGRVTANTEIVAAWAAALRGFVSPPPVAELHCPDLAASQAARPHTRIGIST
jgi:hypothetical protein